MRFNLNGKYEFCPNGNYWEEVSGIFDKSIYLFCDCNKCNGQVYELKPINTTRKISKEKIEQIRKRIKLDEIRYKVDINNMDKVDKLLS